MWEGSERIEIAAPPEAVWAIVTDVARHPEIAGSGEVRAIRMSGPVEAGATWEADEAIKVMGPLTNRFAAGSECVVFDPPREFSWKSYPPPLKKGNPESVSDVTWWFRLSPSGGGTMLEHSFRVVEPRTGGLMLKAFALLTRRMPTIRKGIRRTLQNVKAAAER